MRAQWSNIYYLATATLLLPSLLLPFASLLCPVVVAEDFFRASHCAVMAHVGRMMRKCRAEALIWSCRMELSVFVWWMFF